MKNNEKALGAYIGNIEEIKGRLKRMSYMAEEFFNNSPEEINYGHVGSLEYMLEKLKEIETFMGIEIHED